MNDLTGMTRVLELCLDLEKQALQVYRKLAGLEEDSERQRLWREMADDEASHMQYWHRLLEMNRGGVVPQVFDDLAATENFLAELKNKVRHVAGKVRSGADPEEMLLIALRLEFYLLDPRFQSLFHCLYGLPGGQVPEADYEEHIERLMRALHRFGGASHAFVLLGEAFERLWQTNRQAIHFALTDHLTGLYNRRGLLAAINPLIYLARRNRQPIGVMMIDIDNFKSINDTFGHPAGDRVLAAVAERMRSRLRGSDIIGRYGGEEFLVVMTPVDPGHLFAIAEDLRASVADSPISGVQAAVSIGLASLVMGEDVGKGLERLLHRSDQALLEAKRKGKNRVVTWGEAEPGSDGTADRTGAPARPE